MRRFVDKDVPEDQKAVTEIIIGKQRNGPSNDTVKIAFIRDYAKFENLIEYGEGRKRGSLLTGVLRLVALAGETGLYAASAASGSSETSTVFPSRRNGRFAQLSGLVRNADDRHCADVQSWR